MSVGGKTAAGSEVRRRMFFAASRLRGSGCLPRFLASLSRLFRSAVVCSGVLRLITRRRIKGAQSLRRHFVDADLDLAFVPGLSGKRCKQVERLAVRLQQAQRVPAGSHNEVGTGVDHGLHIAGSRIVAISPKPHQLLRAFSIAYPWAYQPLARPPRLSNPATRQTTRGDHPRSPAPRCGRARR